MDTELRHPARAGPSPRRNLPEVDFRLVLVAIVLLALVVRLLAIDSRLHVDDAYTWLVARQPTPSAFLRQLAATENTPPLWYLLLTPLPIDHVFWLRLPAVLAGTALAPVLALALRRALGAPAALLAALGVAVDPFLITDSDLARGFMLEDLALLVALWAVLHVRERITRRWTVTFVLAGVVAVYTEYSAAIFIVVLVVAALLTGAAQRRRIAALGALVLASLLPWIPEIVRAQNQDGISKLHPMFATPSPVGLRNAAVVLAAGENGGTTSSAGRWLEFGVMAVLGALGAWGLRRAWPGFDERRRATVALLAIASALTLIGHALAGPLGIDVFSQRYMTILVPVAAALGAAALLAAPVRWPALVAVLVLVALGGVSLVRRTGAQFEPDFAPVRAAALATRPHTVLTNTPIVVYYLRALNPAFDRPSNLGPGRASTCARPCLIVDDNRVYGGSPRALTGSHETIGPYILTLEP
jgi:hypothetical protein